MLHQACIVVCMLLWLGPPGIASAAGIPNQASVSGVPTRKQAFSLSCESRSAADWAAYWGVGVSERRFLRKLPRSDNPNLGFVGDPNDPWGNIPPASYGVHAQPVAALLRQFGLEAQARQNMSWDALRREIAAGKPVIVWVIGQMWPGAPLKVTASDGEEVTVARYEHSVILTGYTSKTVTVVDAYSGQRLTYSKTVFLKSWDTLGRMAVTGSGKVKPEPAPVTGQPAPADPPPAAPLAHRVYLPAVFRTGQAENQPPRAQGAQSYVVKRGDFLLAVARKLGVSWIELAELNDLSFPYVIHPGQVLRTGK